ncbi:hypothetical protein [Kitasatospora sp. NPDC087314]|uniref:hypothetical protein n=1 Tax=Kitasatospora sp. NPDC087314 TaxID=3364068 RepID=UPI0038184308
MLDFAIGARLTRELAEMPQLAIQAQLAIQPGASPRGARVSGASPRGARVPLRLDIASYLGPASGDVRDPYGDQDGIVPLAGTLTAWARIHLEECSRFGAPADATIGGLLTYLGRRDVLAWAVTRMWADEYAAEIHDAWRTLDAYAATRARRRPLQLPCPRCGLLSLSQIDGEDIRCGNDACPRDLMSQAEYEWRVEQYLALHDAA